MSWNWILFFLLMGGVYAWGYYSRDYSDKWGDDE